MKECSNFVDLHVAIQFSQHHLLKTVFSQIMWIFLMPLNYTLKNGFKKFFFLQKASLKKKLSYAAVSRWTASSYSWRSFLSTHQLHVFPLSRLWCSAWRFMHPPLSAQRELTHLFMGTHPEHNMCQFSLVTQSCLTLPHGLQHSRPPWPSPNSRSLLKQHVYIRSKCTNHTFSEKLLPGIF